MVCFGIFPMLIKHIIFFLLHCLYALKPKFRHVGKGDFQVFDDVMAQFQNIIWRIDAATVSKFIGLFQQIVLVFGWYAIIHFKYGYLDSIYIEFGYDSHY